MRRFSVFFSAAALLAFISSPLLSAPVFAQSIEFERPLARITEAVDNAKLAKLHNEVHPLIGRSVDQGPVDGALPLDRMTLVLKRSDAQQQALTKLLAEQQDASSPNYHHWLTPQEFGARFGVAESDIQQVTVWLESQGFKVDHVANGRGFIEFSGNAQQVASAFHTSINHYSVNGEAHIANATNLSIPAALAPVVLAVHSLNDFRSKPLHTSASGMVTGTMGDVNSQPSITFDTQNQQHGLAPADYAAIYNIQAVYNSGVTGTGKTIAVVGRSNIKPATLANFRFIFGLGTGNNSTVLNGPDPGVLASVNPPVPCTTQPDCGERDEALLDNEWASAVAPGATVKFVVSKSTATEDGVNLSEKFIIDNNLADVMTESFGSCEAQSVQADADAVSSLAMQAAAQGITYLVSSGDSGAALCADPSSAIATGANATPSVNILASSSFTIAVGGTEFNEGCTIGADGATLNCANYSQFWTASNAASNSATPFLSALGYIPENVWNEACPTTTTGSVTGCGAGANLFAAGGGASQFVVKPSWQKLAIAGIPAADHRYLPDVSLSASGHDFYVVCLQDKDCVPDPTTHRFSLAGIAGTSASTPAFAGIMALVNQKLGRQGDAHATLYRLAANQNYAACNGSSQTSAPSANCVFNDVTVGNNAVPGQTGYGTTAASFQAGAVFDEATGLGSVNVANLISKWPSVAGTTATTTSLTVSPATSTQGASVVLTATVTGSGGTPTGTVSFVDGNNVALGTATLSAGVAKLTTSTLPVGSFTIIAQYDSDATFATSPSTPVSVTVSPSVALIATTTVVTAAPITVTAGQPITFSVAVSHATGAAVPTGSVTLSIDGGPASAPAALSATAAASIVLSNLTVGTHMVVATYSGDATYATSTSSAVSVTVNAAALIGTTTVVTADSKTLPATGVSNITLTATVTPASGSIAPTGTVTFFDGTISLATVTVSSAAGSTATATFKTNILPAAHGPTTRTVSSTLGWIGGGGVVTLACFALMLPTRRRRWPMAVLLLLMGSAMFAVSGCGSGSSMATASKKGPHQVTAKYSGDANYTASTSVALTITVQ